MPLLIKDLEIDSITGPVSMSILVPQPDLINSIKRNIPIVLLFGDKHFSDSGYCQPCSCIKKDHSCCYEIWAKDFLNIFDSLSTKEKPVDFYIEGFANSKDRIEAKKDIYKFSKYMETASQSVGPMVSLRNHLYTCYLREFRGTKAYNELCPTKNIRWQFADSRNANLGFIEPNIYIINNMFIEIAKVANNRFLAIIDKNEPYRLMKSIVDQFKPIVRNEFQEYLELYIRFIKNPLLFFKNLFNPDMDFFKKMATYKQIRKQQFPFNSDVYWSSIFNSYSKHIIAKYKFIENLEYISAVEELSTTEDLYSFFSKQKKEIWEKCIDYAQYISIFLDIYFVTRILKKPDNGIEPFLVIGYFGKEHIENIEYLLEKVMENYVNLGRIDANERCLSIVPIVDLNKIAKTYKGDFRKTSSFFSKLLNK